MIGVVGYYEYIKGIRNDYNLNAILNLKLGEKINRNDSFKGEL